MSSFIGFNIHSYYPLTVLAATIAVSYGGKAVSTWCLASAIETTVNGG